MSLVEFAAMKLQKPRSERGGVDVAYQKGV
jgi:hypothetical protein